MKPPIDANAAHSSGRHSNPAPSSGTRSGRESRPRVLLAHRFYYPDVTTYSQMLRIIGEHLDRDGFGVTVFSTQPGYNGVYRGPPLPGRSDEAGLDVRRVAIPGAGSSLGRLLGGVIYGLWLIAHCVRHRRAYDAISVSTVPPVLMGLCGTIAARLAGAKLVYHCMDLYPEMAIASGISKPGLATRIAGRLDMMTIRAAAKVVVLSEDMAATLSARGHDNDNVVIQNNFTIETASEAAELPAEFARTDEDSFRVLFAGNLGRFQGLDTILQGFLAAKADEPSLELCFMGAGAMEAELRELAGDELGRSVKFWDHSPLPVAMAAIAEADLALVSLAPGLIGSAFPSKTLMYLEMGTRILAVVEPGSSLAALVEDEKVGVVAGVGDPDRLAAALKSEVANRATTAGEDGRDRARAAAARLFSQDTVLPEWTMLYSEITGRDPRSPHALRAAGDQPIASSASGLGSTKRNGEVE